MKLLVVDLLAERVAFGEKGVEEIIRHFPGYEVLLWAPHTDEPEIIRSEKELTHLKMLMQ